MAFRSALGGSMSTSIAAVFLALWSLLPAVASAKDAEVLHLPPLHLEFPSTWQFDDSKSPIEGAGPDGDKVLITVMRRKPDASADSPSMASLASGFAGGPMVEIAAKDGLKVIRAVGAFPTPDGKVGYSAASEESRALGGKTYFVQYLFASPGALIYLTFEGKGEAGPAMLRFDKFLETQRWDD